MRISDWSSDVCSSDLPWTMSEPSSSDAEPRPAKNTSKSLLERLTAFMRPSEPEDREAIKAVLEAAHDRQGLDGESYAMISGAIEIATKPVPDILVTRSTMELMDHSNPLAAAPAEHNETGTSTLPV